VTVAVVPLSGAAEHAGRRTPPRVLISRVRNYFPPMDVDLRVDLTTTAAPVPVGRAGKRRIRTPQRQPYRA
jgi:hypothetical protein